METYRHGYGDMDVDAGTWKHGHGDMPMETRTWRHGHGKHGHRDMKLKFWGSLTFYGKNQMENGSPGDFP